VGDPNPCRADWVEERAGCAEFGLGDRFLLVLPDQENECEATGFAFGRGTGSWVLTVKIGPRHLSTCGF
jgi:hypothetical protein